MFSVTPRLLVPFTRRLNRLFILTQRPGDRGNKKNHQVTTPWVGTLCSGRKGRHQHNSGENNTPCSLLDGRSLCLCLCCSSISPSPPSFPFVLSISMLCFPPPPSVHKLGSLWFIKRSEFRPEGTGCAWRHLKDPAVRDLSFLLRRRHGLPSPPNLLLL